MFNKEELELINLSLAAVIMEVKAKLKIYKSCRLYERAESCQRSIERFEELRHKVVELANAVEQIVIKD